MRETMRRRDGEPKGQRLSPFAFLALLLAVGFARPALAQLDTTAAAPVLVDTTTAQTDASATEVPGTAAPGSALWRSLAVPGWGQAYNRDWIKVPVVVGGVGGLGAYAVILHGRTVRYRRAAIYADCVVTPVDVPEGACDDAGAFEDEFLEAGSLPAASSRALRDTNRRNRDLFVLLGLLAYGLQALDAYVSAELADFDVGEDLSLRVLPTPTGPAASLRWTF